MNTLSWNKAAIPGHDTRWYEVQIPPKWDYLTVNEHSVSNIATEFLIVGSTILRSVFDTVSTPPEEKLDFTVLTRMYCQYSQKVRPDCQFPIELIAAFAQRSPIQQIETRCFKILRSCAGGKNDQVGPYDLLKWREGVVHRPKVDNQEPEYKPDGN